MTEAAKEYDRTLKNRTFLVLVKRHNMVDAYEILFKAANFKHFTGLESPLGSKEFFKRVIKHRLSLDDLYVKDSFLVNKKMEVLIQAMKFPYLARMIGEFHYSGIRIQADYGSGNTHYSMAFREDYKGYLYPVSILNEDIRKTTISTSPIVAIVSKRLDEELFHDLTYKSNNINIEKLYISNIIQDKIDSKVLQRLK